MKNTIRLTVEVGVPSVLKDINSNRQVAVTGNDLAMLTLLDYARIGANHQQNNQTGDFLFHDKNAAEYNKLYHSLCDAT